eukprot:3365665-Alexandrium_andersonii.AAC.1
MAAPPGSPSALGRPNGTCPTAASPRRSGGVIRRAPLLRHTVPPADPPPWTRRGAQQSSPH